MKLRTYPVRICAVLAVTAALTLAPSTAFADDIDGTGGSDLIVGTPGDDEIEGEGGGDTIAGDGVGSAFGGDDEIEGDSGDDTIAGDGLGSAFGGDDEIEGGSGDDTIAGDGLGSAFGGDDEIEGGSGDDTLYGDGFGSIFGGDDEIEGGSGHDTIYGDGPLELFGGNDILYGGSGDDVIFGNSGQDLLCGESGFDLLIGGSGSDIACAVDDEITAVEGVEGMLNLAANDEELDDEGAEVLPLRYRLVSWTDTFIVDPVIDMFTGVLTFNADESGTVEYEAYRSIFGFDVITTAATVFITVEDDDEPVTSEPSAAPEETAVLPNTGAGDTRTQGAIAAMLILGGIALLFGSRRKPNERKPQSGDPVAPIGGAVTSVLDDSDVHIQVMTDRHVEAVRLGALRGVRLLERVVQDRPAPSTETDGHQRRAVQLA